jgi:hypothetical protein
MVGGWKFTLEQPEREHFLPHKLLLQVLFQRAHENLRLRTLDISLIKHTFELIPSNLRHCPRLVRSQPQIHLGKQKQPL